MVVHSLIVIVVSVLAGHAAYALAQPKDIALPPIKSVSFDKHGNFRVNDKPFFPILLYSAPTDDATLGQLREFGFNSLESDAKVCDALPGKGFYGVAHAGQKIESRTGVLMMLGTDSPSLVFKKNLLQQLAEANAKVRKAVPDRPVMNAIGYWEDEPAGVFAGKLPSKEKYEEIIEKIDVAAPYLYPVPYQPIASVGEAMARARKVAGPKPVLPILQLFVWEAKDRYPTPAELRAMAFLSLVEGANGIGYFSYRVGKSTIAEAAPDLWKSVKKLNHDVARIGPLLSQGEKLDAVSLAAGGPAVKLKAVVNGDIALAVLVNSGSERQQARLVWRTKADVSRIALTDGGQALDITNGTLVLQLEPFGVEIVRWAKAR